MTVNIKVSIFEVEKGATPTQLFCAKTSWDTNPETDTVGYGSTPEEALEAWVEEIKEQEIFRPD